ncbi:MAG TPA: hypothetical protein VIJ92_14370 [Ginsengibacter sp.]
MQTENKIRRYYYKKGRRNSKANLRSINANWGYSFFLAGLGLAVLFFAFILQYGFNNIVVSTIGISSLLLVVIGLIILINND